ncbi:conserved exported hypothetical protein [Bradyrhizobium sp. STM 3809]|nr:conserved exported hypothetical protein [Bradyrhizobium sp. STM 3809]
MVAGRLLVLAYLVCVLSPGIALAVTPGAAPCLDEVAVAVSHEHAMHHDVSAATAQRHAHHHHAAEANLQTQQVPAPAPAHHDHGKLPGPCCAMMCAVGLTAVLPVVTGPAALATASEAARETALPGRTPPRLDRPPIALA